MNTQTLSLEGMTSAIWENLPQSERDYLRDLSELSPQLTGLEGCRVEVQDNDGKTRRFKVGRSTGWRPCHLELHNARCIDGYPADKTYAKVTVIRRPL